MTTNLVDLVQRLQAIVPQSDGVPGDYEQLVKDAVEQLGNDVPMVRRTTLSIVSGTATYDLPADFRYLIALDGITVGEGVILTTDKLVAAPTSYSETYTVEGDSITFDPTPTYNADRSLKYAAGYLLDDATNSYLALTVNGARAAMLYARYLALSAQVDAAARQAWSYSIGEEAVNKTQLSKALADQAERVLRDYKNALAGQKNLGIRASYKGVIYGSSVR